MVHRYQVETRVKELLFDANQDLYQCMQKLLDSGAIDFERYEDNYLLPKMLLHVALLRVAESYHISPDTAMKADIANLKLFT